MINRRNAVKLGLSSILLPFIGAKAVSNQVTIRMYNSNGSSRAVRYPEDGFIRWRYELDRPFDRLVIEEDGRSHIGMIPWKHKSLSTIKGFNKELQRHEDYHVKYTKTNKSDMYTYYYYDMKKEQCMICTRDRKLSSKNFELTGAYWN
jgi:hypothetical protein